MTATRTPPRFRVFRLRDALGRWTWTAELWCCNELVIATSWRRAIACCAEHAEECDR